MSNNTKIHSRDYRNSHIIIDGEKYRHLASEFHSIPRKDKESLKAFFEKYKHLTNNQLARIVSRSNILIRKLKHSCGIINPPPNHKPKNIGIASQKVPIKTNTLAEIMELAKTYSVNSIAKSLNRPVSTIHTILKRNGCTHIKKVSDIKSSNPCCSYHWLYTNYILNGLSVNKCAKLAGVYPQTISAWLVKYKIPMVNRIGSQVAWIRDTLSILSQDKDNVKEIRLNSKKIVISYYGVIEHYYYNVLYNKKRFKHYYVTEKSFAINNVPELKPIWAQGLDINTTNLRLDKRDLKKATLIERRYAINKYANYQFKRGYSKIYANKDAIKKDVEILKKSNLDFNINGEYVQRNNNRHLNLGRHFLLRYYDYSENYKHIYKSKRKMHYVIHKLMSTRYSIDDYSIQCKFCKIKWFDYLMLARIIRDLGLAGSILDISKHNYGIILTAEKLDATYYYPSEHTYHTDAIAEGAKEFLSIDYIQHTDEKVDNIIANFQYSEVDLDMVKKYLKYGKRFIAICDKKSAAFLMSKMRPKKVIEFKKALPMDSKESILIY